MKARMLAIVLAGLAAGAHAAERATLANGFALDCHHHAVVDGRMRLYTTADESNYIEFAPAEVAAFEAVPDPVAVPQPAASETKPSGLLPLLSSAGHAHNLDVELLASVVRAESGGNPLAKSHAGAQGLMQLMPKTAADHGVTSSFEPQQNVRGGAAYLDELLTRYHEDLALALAAYNAGPAAVDRYHGIPPYHETRAYVARVIREFNRRVMERERAAQASSQRASE
ncbi:lytic transglycosylase domain-containing protein [Terracidiphilus gabretensis]|uniref:lytic transglycosylase domain-containing protein n=1 Tax=Terracidiphilus gabretensis TaxID=1577687 RepID=UPI00071BED74|nr:lytic transglycosylase domain-containing protein [Terracidiphilus gabretensis]